LAVMAELPAARRLPMVVTGGIPRGIPREGRDQIHCLGNINLTELAGLYRGARAFVYPTLNEGFGYPPLEAWAQGTPVVAAAISSVTEVLGDAAIYFSPTSLDEMKIRIRLAAEDDDLLAMMSSRGRDRFKVVRDKQRQDLDELCQMLARWTG